MAIYMPRFTPRVPPRNPLCNTPQVIHLDLLIYKAQVAFKNVKEYGHFYKPKHHFATHAPVNTLRMGPMRGYWCYSFEGFHQRVKRIAKDSNYINICKRVVDFYCMQFGVHLGCSDPKRQRKLSTLA